MFATPDDYGDMNDEQTIYNTRLINTVAIRCIVI